MHSEAHVVINHAELRELQYLTPCTASFCSLTDFRLQTRTTCTYHYPHGLLPGICGITKQQITSNRSIEEKVQERWQVYTSSEVLGWMEVTVHESRHQELTEVRGPVWAQFKYVAKSDGTYILSSILSTALGLTDYPVTSMHCVSICASVQCIAVCTCLSG